MATAQDEKRQQDQASDSENDQQEYDDAGPQLDNESESPMDEEQQETQPARPTKTKKAPRKRRGPRNDPFAEDSQQQMVSRRQQQQQPMQQQQMMPQMPQGQIMGAPQNEKKNPLKLRLDLNLDVEIELRAKIHGDVTLALLDMG